MTSYQNKTNRSHLLLQSSIAFIWAHHCMVFMSYSCFAPPIKIAYKFTLVFYFINLSRLRVYVMRYCAVNWFRQIMSLFRHRIFLRTVGHRPVIHRYLNTIKRTKLTEKSILSLGSNIKINLKSLKDIYNLDSVQLKWWCCLNCKCRLGWRIFVFVRE